MVGENVTPTNIFVCRTDLSLHITEQKKKKTGKRNRNKRERKKEATIKIPFCEKEIEMKKKQQ